MIRAWLTKKRRWSIGGLMGVVAAVALILAFAAEANRRSHLYSGRFHRGHLLVQPADDLDAQSLLKLEVPR